MDVPYLVARLVDFHFGSLLSTPQLTNTVNDKTYFYLQQSCANNCMEKYMKMTQRISQRFQEYQMQQNEGSLASAATNIPR